MSKLPVIHLLGGPCSGKSTAAALCYVRLKQAGYNVEFAPEVAKACVWSGAVSALSDQLYLLGQSNRLLQVLEGQCDAAITDGSILTCLVYNTRKLQKLDDIVLEAFHQYNNFVYVVKRDHADYIQSGRVQTEAQSIELDDKFLAMLNGYKIPHRIIPRGDEGVEMILDDFVAWYDTK